jgi:hypothetical protein
MGGRRENKRTRKGTSSPSEPANKEMEELFITLSNTMDAMQSQLTKLDSLPALESAVHQLVKENTTLREEVAAIAVEMKKKD